MRALSPPPSSIENEWEPILNAADVDDVGESLGYGVDDPNGWVGIVEGIVAGAWTDRPDAIEVRVGLFRPAALMISVEMIASVDHARRRIILNETADFGEAYASIG